MYVAEIIFIVEKWIASLAEEITLRTKKTVALCVQHWQYVQDVSRQMLFDTSNRKYLMKYCCIHMGHITRLFSLLDATFCLSGVYLTRY